jgi:hypothetical protein
MHSLLLPSASSSASSGSARPSGVTVSGSHNGGTCFVPIGR